MRRERFEAVGRAVAWLIFAPEPWVRSGARVAKIWLSLSVGDFAQAEESLRVAADELDGGERDNPQLRAALHLFTAGLRRAERRFDAVFREVQEARRVFDSPAVQLSLAVAQKHTGDVAAALDTLGPLIGDPAVGQLAGQARVGYLYLVGESDLADRERGLLHPPSRTSELANEAWIAACQGDLERCSSDARYAMARGYAPYVRTFLATDVEFDRFASDPGFAELSGR